MNTAHLQMIYIFINGDFHNCVNYPRVDNAFDDYEPRLQINDSNNWGIGNFTAYWANVPP